MIYKKWYKIKSEFKTNLLYLNTLRYNFNSHYILIFTLFFFFLYFTQSHLVSSHHTLNLQIHSFICTIHYTQIMNSVILIILPLCHVGLILIINCFVLFILTVVSCSLLLCCFVFFLKVVAGWGLQVWQELFFFTLILISIWNDNQKY